MSDTEKPRNTAEVAPQDAGATMTSPDPGPDPAFATRWNGRLNGGPGSLIVLIAVVALVWLGWAIFF